MKLVQKRSKYNVSGDKSKRTFAGIVFDSELEKRYYAEIVLPKFNSGEIKHFELQKKYKLQPSFKRNGETIRAIDYVADFYIEYANGKIELIDTKGIGDSVAKMKRKMMYYLYPDLDYKWLSYSKKYGGWIEYDTLQKKRREAKKEKKNKELIEYGI